MTLQLLDNEGVIHGQTLETFCLSTIQLQKFVFQLSETYSNVFYSLYSFLDHLTGL